MRQIRGQDTDLGGILAGVMQTQQQRHQTLQHQFPQGSPKPQPETPLSPPHQRPKESHS